MFRNSFNQLREKERVRNSLASIEINLIKFFFICFPPNPLISIRTLLTGIRNFCKIAMIPSTLNRITKKDLLDIKELLRNQKNIITSKQRRKHVLIRHISSTIQLKFYGILNNKQWRKVGKDINQEDSHDDHYITGENLGLKRDRGESKEAKKRRKLTLKVKRREARIRKKGIQGAFAKEELKQKRCNNASQQSAVMRF